MSPRLTSNLPYQLPLKATSGHCFRLDPFAGPSTGADIPPRSLPVACRAPKSAPAANQRLEVQSDLGQDPKSIKKPAFLAGLVEVLGSFRMLSDYSNGGAGGNRTPVHKSYATSSTYVAQSIVLTARYPTGRESKQPAR